MPKKKKKTDLGFRKNQASVSFKVDDNLLLALNTNLKNWALNRYPDNTWAGLVNSLLEKKFELLNIQRLSLNESQTMAFLLFLRNATLNIGTRETMILNEIQTEIEKAAQPNRQPSTQPAA